MKILVTGEHGRLGSHLVSMGCIPAGVDITDREQVAGLDGDVLINCAAYTKVDAAENATEYRKALEINTGAVNIIRKFFRGRVIHISTDYIFNGQHGPYSETSEYNYPINLYGMSKWGGEVVMLEPPRKGDTVVRTTGLYGGVHGGTDFAKAVLSALSNGDNFVTTNNLRANQTYIPHLAQALLDVAHRDDNPPLLHLASKNIVTRYEFGCMIAQMFGYNTRNIIPVKSKDIPGWVAPRPVNGGLVTSYASRHGYPIYSIQEGLAEYRAFGGLK